MLENLISQEIIDLVSWFALDLVFATFIIRYVYFKHNRKAEYYVTFLLLNVLIYFTAAILSSAQLQTGFAFGMFAIFSILRYRTEQIPIKEMTFLFISIVLAIINGIGYKSAGMFEIIIVNVIISLAVVVLEKKQLKHSANFQLVQYEKIELVKEDRRNELLQDLAERTGLSIKDIEITKIDFLRDTAVIKVFHD